MEFPNIFTPRRGLGGGHRQTLAGALFPPRNALPTPERRLFRVALDAEVLAFCNWQPQPTRALTVIIVHGLEGSSESPYVIRTANKVWNAGMNVVRMNVRNCGGTERLAPTLYHSGLSADVGQITRALIGDGFARLALAGFSMGGNQVLKLAGEWASHVPRQVRAVAAVSPVVDLAVCADAIHRSRNLIYEINFIWNLKRTLRRKAACFPGQFEALRGIWSIREFDNLVTAPHFGFADADDYYARATAAPLLARIAVPTLVIHSKDDPFVGLTPETRGQLLANANICFIETEHGGHCAFLAQPDGYDGRWAEQRVLEFFQQQQ